jgi:hypothetical protein
MKLFIPIWKHFLFVLERSGGREGKALKAQQSGG